MEKQAILFAAFMVFSSVCFGAEPVLEVSPLELNFTADEGGANPASQIVSVWRSGGNGPLNWDYIKTALKPETPIDLVLQLGTIMLDTLNERQRIYSNCKCLMVKGNLAAAKGSTVFALSFYTHKALRKTNRNNVDEILCGERDIDISEIDDFPNFVDTTKVVIYAMNTLIESTKIWKKFIKLIPHG